MKLPLTPAASIALSVFLTALVLQWGVIHYLSGLSKNQFYEETRKLKIQITKDLAVQLARALAADDDLGALIVLKSARSNHPQLQKAEVFAANGKIILHTNPEMIGKKNKPHKKFRPISPELSKVRIDGRPLTVILVPMPENEDLYFRAYFDDTPLLQAKKFYAVRLYLLIIATSFLLALYILFRLSRFELLDPQKRADPKDLTRPDDTHTHRIAELLLSEMRHAALAIDHNNKIIAANSLTLELLNCRTEELKGMHVMQSPMPKSLLEFYQNAIKTPDRVTKTKLALASKEPALPVKITCIPASSEWKLALISLI